MPVLRQIIAGSAHGWEVYRNLDLGTTGAVVKNSAGQVGGWVITNLGAATRYVKFYDKATAPDQTDAPKLTLAIPAGSVSEISIVAGIAFGNGIGLRATTGIADDDTGTPGANEVVANILYK